MGTKLVPLGEITPVHFGVKTGADAFFLPRDVSQISLQEYGEDADFRIAFGVSRSSVEQGNLALIGAGASRSEVHAIEREYLEPEIHSLMYVDELSVTEESCPFQIVLIPSNNKIIKSKLALNYIAWGESKGFHKNSTCASRITDSRKWYDLTYHKRPAVVLPKIQQYRLIAFLNPKKLYQNSSLLGIYSVKGEDAEILCAILNSTLSILSRLVYARILGNEGNVQLDVYAANMMLIPDVRLANTERIRSKILDAFTKMGNRKVRAFLSERRLREMSYRQSGKDDELINLSTESELTMPDRRQLDDVVLEMLGISSKNERDRLNATIYSYLEEFFELTRQKEEKAIVNKRLANRGARIRPLDIAKQIVDGIKEFEFWILEKYDPKFIDTNKAFDTFDIPEVGIPVQTSDMFDGSGLLFVKGRGQTTGRLKTLNKRQDDLITLLVSDGIRGLTRIPHEPDECLRVLNDYDRFVRRRNERLKALIDERTSDPDLQDKIFLLSMIQIRNQA